MKQKSFSIYRRWCSWFGNIGNAVVNADSGTRLHTPQPRRYTRLHIRQPSRQCTLYYRVCNILGSIPSNLLRKPSSRKSTMRRRFLNQIAVCTRIPFIILDIRGALWFCLLASYRALGHFSAVFFSCFLVLYCFLVVSSSRLSGLLLGALLWLFHSEYYRTACHSSLFAGCVLLTPLWSQLIQVHLYRHLCPVHCSVSGRPTLSS